MTVAYAPPLTRAPARYGDCLTHEAVREGPAYGRTVMGTRWHRIRSSYLAIRDWDSDCEIRQVWHFWCGQAATSGGRSGPPLLADAPGPGEPACGTCEGRAIGADADRPEWLFTPWRLDPPPVCPGSGGDALADDGPPSRCLVCGDYIAIRGLGRWYNARVGLVRHPPGPGLVDGCEFHGWRELVRVGDTVSCRCRCVID